MEQIVFPVLQICEYLTEETKTKVYSQAERDDQGSKVTEFFDKVDDLYNEMRWQKKLRGQPWLWWLSTRMSLWGTISFNMAVLINIIVAIYYLFSVQPHVLDHRVSGLLWLALLVSLIVVVIVPRPAGIRALILSFIIRLIYSVGVGPTFFLLGIANVVNKFIFLMSLIGNRGTFTKDFKSIMTDFEFVYHLGYLLICIMAVFIHEFFYSILLLDIVYREETLLNVITSVTRNGRSILLTGVLALIVIYLFSICGYLFLQQDFVMEVDRLPAIAGPTVASSSAATVAATVGASSSMGVGVVSAGVAISAAAKSGKVDKVDKVDKVEEVCEVGSKKPACLEKGGKPALLKKANDTVTVVEESDGGEEEGGGEEDEEDEDNMESGCDSLLICIVTTLNQGLRNGGGIGDVLRKPSFKEKTFIARVVYDLIFFFVVIIILLNLIFGIIIDTFADLRGEKQEKEEVLKNTCFICGLDRSSFDNKAVSFEEHIKIEHNMWHFLYFIVLIKVKDPTEFTGPESYVYSLVQEKSLEWFPRMRAMSLVADEEEGEQNELRNLQAQLDSTNTLVRTLTAQLTELKDQMTEQRKQKQRIGLLNTSTMPTSFS